MSDLLERFGAWMLGETVTGFALASYERLMGSLAPLCQELALSSTDISKLAPAERARLSGRAISYLAAYLSNARGVAPLRAGDWRVIRYALYSGRTLGEAIARCADCFDAIDGRCGRMSLRIALDQATLVLDPERVSADPLTCLIDLHGVAHICGLLSSLIQRPLPVTDILLNHDPADLAEIGTPPVTLTLGAGQNGFMFPAAYLDHPVLGTFEEAGRHSAYSFLFSTFRGEDDSQPVSIRVREIALTSLRRTGQIPRFERIVEMLDLSPATLRRRLSEGGTTYREIKDSCRRELALNLLMNTDSTVEALAARLDFCDSDAFRSAFRTWFNSTPSDFRAKLAAERTADIGYSPKSHSS